MLASGSHILATNPEQQGKNKQVGCDLFPVFLQEIDTCESRNLLNIGDVRGYSR